jgi:hypothetical protein
MKSMSYEFNIPQNSIIQQVQITRIVCTDVSLEGYSQFKVHLADWAA